MNNYYSDSFLTSFNTQLSNISLLQNSNPAVAITKAESERTKNVAKIMTFLSVQHFQC